MANGDQNHEEVLEKMRKQLSVVVRSIHWSYAIFWSLSTADEGVLEWREGYYNGDIKTRKAVQAMELTTDKIGLKRSEQLRELYKCLSEGETHQQAKRTSSPSSSALSPEDLTDAEWYYLVCMSFVFSLGQSLPGQALANGKTIWLCNAQHADSKVFNRSLLAKSASIQTVVCFPHLDGVIEIGVTDLVLKDHNLLQHIKAALLDFSKPFCTTKSCYRTDNDDDNNDDDDKDQMSTKVDHEKDDPLNFENLSSPAEDIRCDHRGTDELNGNHEDFDMDSPDECSNGCDHNHQTEDSFMLEGTNGGASQVQSWHFMDDDIGNGVQHSMNSSDCKSEAFANHEKVVTCPGHEDLNQNCLRELQNFNHTKLSSLDLGADDDLHYKKTVTAILGGPTQLIELYCSQNCDRASSFAAWKKGLVDSYRLRIQQKMLKKILFSVPFMYQSSSLKSHKKVLGKDWLENLHNDCMGHVKYKKSRESENLFALSSTIPSISKNDKAVILKDTIKYLKELEERVEELESCKHSVNNETKARKEYLEVIEKTSDNYDNKMNDNGRNSWMHKRKACDIDETDTDLNRFVHNDGHPLDLKVSIKDQEVQIDIKCPYKEYILLDIMDAINDLHLNSYSVQSSNLDGVFTLTLKSKFRGTAIASVGMIKQALWKVAGKC